MARVRIHADNGAGPMLVDRLGNHVGERHSAVGDAAQRFTVFALAPVEAVGRIDRDGIKLGILAQLF